MVGAGKAEGAIDAGNMLKPALARGELHCVGATTLDEYRKYIEKDAALERRFQKVLVERAVGRKHDRDSARAAGEIRGAPWRRHHRSGDRRRGGTVASLHHRPFPAGQGDRPDRRGGVAHQDGNRFQAGGHGQARPAADPAQDRARGGEEGEGRGVAQAACVARRRNQTARTRVLRSRGNLEGREIAGAGLAARQGRDREAQARDGSSETQGRLAESVGNPVRPHSAARSAVEAGRQGAGEGTEAEVVAHPGRRRGNRRGGVARDRHSGFEDDAGRTREAAADGRPPAPARGRPGRGGAAGVGCDPAFARGSVRSQQTVRLVPVPRARPASARPNCARRWPNSCSIPKST